MGALALEFHEHVEGRAPAVLLPYQQRWVADKAQIKIADKSRRVGLTWAEASDDVLLAATEGRDGMDVLYIGYNKEMTREYIQTCAWWVKKYGKAAGEIEETIVEDEDKDILAFRIKFASGHEVLALTSRPSNLRGRQGRVVIDEAAFHDDLKGLVKAALALLMWGGDVRIISTHDGEDNHYNELIQDSLAGRKPYSVHRITLDDALNEGLYRRICLIRGIEWTKENEQKWRSDLIEAYGDGADEELHCIPSKGSGSWLTRNIIESCMDSSIPVVRWTPPADDFVDWPVDRAAREVKDWCEQNLKPLLEAIPKHLRTWVGEDFGRSGDLTDIWPVVRRADLSLHTPFLLELRNAPFRVQKQVLYYVLDRVPNLTGVALDARGNGQYLAEVTRQDYGGPEVVHEVMLSQPWYREHMPRVKAALEDRTADMPEDADVLDDMRGIKMIRGVASPPDASYQGTTGQRHYDSGVAFAMALYAEAVIEPIESDWDVCTSGTSSTSQIMSRY